MAVQVSTPGTSHQAERRIRKKKKIPERNANIHAFSINEFLGLNKITHIEFDKKLFQNLIFCLNIVNVCTYRANWAPPGFDAITNGK
jgi:hypothetical protein